LSRREALLSSRWRSKSVTAYNVSLRNVRIANQIVEEMPDAASDFPRRLWQAK
jgi:hypothetical protein